MGTPKDLPIGTARGAEVAGHGAPGTAVLGGAAVPVDLATEDAGFEAQHDPGAFRRALERLVGDEAYRDAMLADPTRAAFDLGLDPGGTGLLLAVCWAAYGPEVAGQAFKAW